ncbi:MAG TPA: ATP-dependent DNA helicase [Actinomycetota bacterium]|nr:ATP-dependent DNA helicase [Actinomycetota bacterium]
MTRRASAAVRAALRDHDPSDEQWAAIVHEPVPVAIIAGAGSGKTAVMAARVVWLTEEAAVSPAQILGLTFTNKAAAELEERVRQAFEQLDPPPTEHPHIATYHAYADSLLREHGVRIGIDPEVGLLSEAQRWQLLLSCFDDLPPFDAIDSRSPSSICRSVLGLADSLGNHLVTPEAVIEEDQRILADAGQFPDEVVVCSRRRIELARVVRAYTDAKVRARRIDFGDQVTRAVEILEQHPVVAADLRERYPAILLDEYQDTNVAQRRLIQLLAPTGHNVTAVGDARQNIFQWRGSTLFNLIDFPTRHFLRAGSEPHEYLSLSENFRSGRKILAVANRVIDRVPAERRPGQSLRPFPDNGEGWVGVKLCADQEQEAAFIATEVERLHDAGEAWSEFAILVRRKAHIRAIHDALRSRGIPVDVVGLAGLLEVPEVMDAVAWLRAIADPGPSANRWLARILLGPRFRIHYRDLALLARWAARRTHELAEGRRKQLEGAGEDGAPAGNGAAARAEVEPDEVAYSLWEALDHLEEIAQPDPETGALRLGPEAVSRLQRARREITRLRSGSGEPLADLVQAVIREAGIAEALETLGSGALVNITGFLGVVAGFAPVSGDPSLPAFLAYLDAAEEVEETLEVGAPSAVDSVKLMTVHQAKGLEFNVVFVPGVAARMNDKGERVDSIFPDERTSNPMTSYGQLPHSVREDAEHLPNPWLPDGRPRKKAELLKELKERAVEDERRLFYVALTRARQRLYVTAAWWYQRQAKPRGPSVFFEEVATDPETEVLPPDPMPEESPLLERMAELAVWPPDPPHRLRIGDLFPAGYPAALDALLAGEVTPASFLDRLDPAARERAGLLLAEHRTVATALARDAGRGPAAAPGLPSVSATQLAGLLAKRVKEEDLLRPPPRRPSGAARLGVEVHRWIEEQARGLTGLADEEALDDPSVPFEAARIGGMKERFAAMGFADRTLARLDNGMPMAELPFTLKVGGRVVRGRIDAVYETGGGGLEVVDFKTGRRVEDAGVDQLAIYAAALRKLGVAPPGPLKVTYCYLADGSLDSREITPEEVDAALAEIAAGLGTQPERTGG